MPVRRPHWVWILVISAVTLALAILLLLPTRDISPGLPPATLPGSNQSQTETEAFGDSPPSALPSSESPLVPVTPIESTPSPITEWEDRLDNVLSAETDNRTMARQLLEGLQSLPADAQEEFIAHALNLCEDDDYGRVEMVYLAGGTSAIVVEEIFNDALNRPDEIKLPLLAKTLRNPAHPMAGEAREILEMYLDLEEGAAPPPGWEPAVQQYLVKEQE